MTEGANFVPSWRPAELVASEVALFRESAGLLRVQLVANQYGCPRHGQRPAVRLEPGQWIRWQINYRFVDCCTGEWYYRLDTLNLAHGATRPDVFLAAPDHLVDQRARLF